MYGFIFCSYSFLHKTLIIQTKSNLFLYVLEYICYIVLLNIYIKKLIILSISIEGFIIKVVY